MSSLYASSRPCPPADKANTSLTRDRGQSKPDSSIGESESERKTRIVESPRPRVQRTGIIYVTEAYTNEGVAVLIMMESKIGPAPTETEGKKKSALHGIRVDGSGLEAQLGESELFRLSDRGQRNVLDRNCGKSLTECGFYNPTCNWTSASDSRGCKGQVILGTTEIRDPRQAHPSVKVESAVPPGRLLAFNAIQPRATPTMDYLNAQRSRFHDPISDAIAINRLAQFRADPEYLIFRAKTAPCSVSSALAASIILNAQFAP
ncbi:hypothetical protein DFH09DRAFT_1094324 [Mycena vulgaris]|nr:hypothetical protein DFH09DRAFT_1094324 [Mycena vulgaris]